MIGATSRVKLMVGAVEEGSVDRAGCGFAIINAAARTMNAAVDRTPGTEVIVSGPQSHSRPPAFVAWRPVFPPMWPPSRRRDRAKSPPAGHRPGPGRDR